MPPSRISDKNSMSLPRSETCLSDFDYWSLLNISHFYTHYTHLYKYWSFIHIKHFYTHHSVLYTSLRFIQITYFIHVTLLYSHRWKIDQIWWSLHKKLKSQIFQKDNSITTHSSTLQNMSWIKHENGFLLITTTVHHQHEGGKKQKVY